MSSILNTDISDLVSQWGERVAFNEGYQKQKIAEATQAGRDAFSSGLDLDQGRDLYFEMQAHERDDVQAFLSSDSAAEDSAELFQEDFESMETFGMESVVCNDTFDVDHWADVSGLNDFERSL